MKKLYFLTALSFCALATNLAQGSIWEERRAAPRPRPVTAQMNLGVLRVQIPRQLGSVIEVRPGASPWIIHIQDAHLHYAAQKNSAAILKILARSLRQNFQQAPLPVYIEGSSGPVHADWLAIYPDAVVKKEFSEALLKQGKITAEEFLEIQEGPGILRIHGVEDPALYAANLQARKEIDVYRAQIQKHLQNLEARLRRLPESLEGAELSLALRQEMNFWSEHFTPDDWEPYRQGQKNRRSLRRIEALLNIRETRLGIASTEFADFNEPRLRFLQEAYYRLAFQRNEAMVRRLLDLLAEKKSPSPVAVVLIAGGFHTEGITQLLRERGAAYIVIRPQLQESE